jgi:hypothetical protein
MINLDEKHRYFIKLRKILLKHKSVTEEAISEIVEAVAAYSIDFAWYVYAGDAIG